MSLQSWNKQTLLAYTPETKGRICLWQNDTILTKHAHKTDITSVCIDRKCSIMCTYSKESGNVRWFSVKNGLHQVDIACISIGGMGEPLQQFNFYLPKTYTLLYNNHNAIIVWESKIWNLFIPDMMYLFVKYPICTIFTRHHDVYKIQIRCSGNYTPGTSRGRGI